jgi:hypothetical protein
MRPVVAVTFEEEQSEATPSDERKPDDPHRAQGVEGRGGDKNAVRTHAAKRAEIERKGPSSKQGQLRAIMMT